jgi:hypothetical protein
VRPGQRPRLIVETAAGRCLGLVIHDVQALPGMMAALAPHVPAGSCWYILPAGSTAAH